MFILKGIEQLQNAIDKAHWHKQPHSFIPLRKVNLETV
jgi:hypothetical protein